MTPDVSSQDGSAGQGTLCRNCGTALSPGAQFCAGCGAAVPPAVLFCADCGTEFSTEAQFCAGCGHARTVASAPRAAARRAAAISSLRKMKRSTKIALVGVVAAALIIGLVFAFLPRDSRTPGVTGTFVLGQSNPVAGAAIASDGGAIQVQDSSSSLDGMTLTVPQGAYTDQVDFTISEAKIVSSTFGPDFTPVTPMITIDNGGIFAEQPLEVTIPIHINDNEFAMGFYYDAEMGRLEGIPFAELTNDSITLVTCHFSDIAILKANSGRILEWAKDGIDSGFRPGHDDFNADNYGSIISPGGHCAGQNIAEVYYYSYLKDNFEGEVQLHGQYDNDGFEPATPALWQDDAKGLRLSSVLQKKYALTYKTNSALVEYKNFMKQQDDLKTFYALAYSMEASGDPQLIGLYRKTGNGGHSIIAYRIEGDSILVADPNYTGVPLSVTLNRHAAVVGPQTNPQFLPYYSAQNASEAKKKTPYDWIAYWGDYAMVDFNTVAMNWETVYRGGDAGIGVFSADPQIIVCLGMKEDPLYGAVLDEVPIDDGLTVNLTMLDELAVNGGGRLYYKGVPQEAGRYAIVAYANGESAESLSQPGMPDAYSYIRLRPGENEVGLCVYMYFTDPNYNPNDPKSVDGSGYQFLDYLRYTIYYNDGATETTESTTATTPTTLDTTITGAVDFEQVPAPQDQTLDRYVTASNPSDSSDYRVYATYTRSYLSGTEPRFSISVWEYSVVDGQAVSGSAAFVYSWDIGTAATSTEAAYADAAAAIARRMADKGLVSTAP